MAGTGSEGVRCGGGGGAEGGLRLLCEATLVRIRRQIFSQLDWFCSLKVQKQSVSLLLACSLV